LAASQYRNGNYIEAEALLRKALSIREREVGSSHASTLSTKSHLGATLGRLRRLDEAEAIFREVLSKREEVLGLDNKETLMSANHLGVVLKQQGKVLGNDSECERLLLRALKGLERKNGINHVMTAEASYNYAVLKVLSGKRQTACMYFGQAHKVREILLGFNH
jgi:tetratricopeptide (TPR) repeat protein